MNIIRNIKTVLLLTSYASSKQSKMLAKQTTSILRKVGANIVQNHFLKGFDDKVETTPNIEDIKLVDILIISTKSVGKLTLEQLTDFIVANNISMIFSDSNSKVLSMILQIDRFKFKGDILNIRTVGEQLVVSLTRHTKDSRKEMYDLRSRRSP